MADKKKPARTDQERLADEVVRAGGERALKGIEDRDLWGKQAVVLSFLREHADLQKAALQAGEFPTTAIGWLDGNVLDFADRVSVANREVGYRLHGTVLERIISGEIKSPGVIKMVLESLLPELYGKDADPKDNEGKNAMTLLREMHKEWLDNKARDEGILFDTQRAQELSGAPVTLALPDRVQRDSNGIAGSD